jgi:hypothetical protein
VCIYPNSCSIHKLEPAQQATFREAREARRVAIASLRAVLDAAATMASVTVPSQAYRPLPTSAISTTFALRQPQVPFPGQVFPQAYPQSDELQMAQLPQGSAGQAWEFGRIAPKRSSTNLMDVPLPKRHNV